MSHDPNASVERFSGFADCYDVHRPTPPGVIADLLTQLAQVTGPRLVVDLGSGTGLSTRIWAGRAESVIGVEPNADMRRQAGASTGDRSIAYREGLSSQTGLEDACADIVTCSQSLHWMEPESTFAEAARILRPGGVFAAYDCDWPPLMRWEVTAAFIAFMSGVRALEKEHGVTERVSKWAKDKHLERMRECGRFRFVREAVLHSVEMGNAERVVGLAASFGSVATLFKLGLSEEQIGLDRLREVANRTVGDEPSKWYFCYRVRLGMC